MKNTLLWTASLIIVLVLFHICYGLSVIDPRNINWLMSARHDWGQHYLGFYTYRFEPWYFPLGDMHHFYYPLGTNVGYTDSIPLLAIFFKIFSPILPEDFQYLGGWLFLCFLLTAWYTVLICRRFKVNGFFTSLIVAFIVVNPVLIYRGMHPALCGQWLFLGSLYVFLQPNSDTSPKKMLLHQLILLLISSLINPYICFMVLGFTFITPLRLAFYDKLISKKAFFVYEAVSIAGVLLLWYVVGLIGTDREDMSVAGAYGLYSLNLNALYNAKGYSTLLPAFKDVSWHQYEGFMYLGGGMLLLLLILMVMALYRQFTGKNNPGRLKAYWMSKRNYTRPLLILVIILTLFSITHIVSFNDKVLFKIPLPGFLKDFGGIFRASGRFFWIPYYMIFFVVLIAVTRFPINKYVKTGLLLAALFVQFYDTTHLLTHRKLPQGTYHPPLENKDWITLMEQFDEIVFYPPFENHQLNPMDYQDFCFLAAKVRKPINIGYVARLAIKGMQRYHDSLSAQLNKGSISPRTLYITTLPHLNTFIMALEKDSCQLNVLDNYCYLFAKNIKNDTLISISNRINQENKKLLDSALLLLAKKSEFRETATIENTGKNEIRFFIERINTDAKVISLEGWAFRDTAFTNTGDSIFITLASSTRSYLAPAGIKKRPDITSTYNRKLDAAGFNALIFNDQVVPGEYQLGLAIKSRNGKMVYQPTGRVVNAGVPESAKPKTITTRPPISDDIMYGIDKFETNGDSIEITGWAAFRKMNADESQIQILLLNDDRAYTFTPEPVLRPDVSTAQKGGFDHSGFSIKIWRRALEKGKYQLGIHINHATSKKNGMALPGKEATIF